MEDDEIGERESAWISHAESLGYQPWPPEGLAVNHPVYADFSIPVIDGLDAASDAKVYAIYCFSSGAWVLCQVEVRPDGYELRPRLGLVVRFDGKAQGGGIVALDGVVQVVKR